jgi:hypothetical protein
MSVTISLIKTAIKWTPNKMIMWVANSKLKGIAELTDFNFDLEARKVYVQATLVGEAESLEVWLDGFAVFKDEGSYKMIIQQAQSNRPWLSNLLSRIIGKDWKIPAIPQLTAPIDLLTELFKVETPEQQPEQQDENPKQEDESPVRDECD